eukprot:1086269-Rhodomonas_salina.3
MLEAEHAMHDEVMSKGSMDDDEASAWPMPVDVAGLRARLSTFRNAEVEGSIPRIVLRIRNAMSGADFGDDATATVVNGAGMHLRKCSQWHGFAVLMLTLVMAVRLNLYKYTGVIYLTPSEIVTEERAAKR